MPTFQYEGVAFHAFAEAATLITGDGERSSMMKSDDYKAAYEAAAEIPAAALAEYWALHNDAMWFV